MVRSNICILDLVLVYRDLPQKFLYTDTSPNDICIIVKKLLSPIISAHYISISIYIYRPPPISFPRLEMLLLLFSIDIPAPHAPFLLFRHLEVMIMLALQINNDKHKDNLLVMIMMTMTMTNTDNLFVMIIMTMTNTKTMTTCW